MDCFVYGSYRWTVSGYGLYKENRSDGRISETVFFIGAAIGTRESDYTRVAALAAEHVDVIIIDSAQGDSTYQVRHASFYRPWCK